MRTAIKQVNRTIKNARKAERLGLRISHNKYSDYRSAAFLLRMMTESRPIIMHVPKSIDRRIGIAKALSEILAKGFIALPRNSDSLEPKRILVQLPLEIIDDLEGLFYRVMVENASTKSLRQYVKNFRIAKDNCHYLA